MLLIIVLGYLFGSLTYLIVLICMIGAIYEMISCELRHAADWIRKLL